MQTIRAAQALLPEGWAENVLVTLDHAGGIASVETRATGGAEHAVDILLPAPVNAHSHAFQRAMAGLTERRGPDPSDSFWTWRRLMYRFLDRLTPEHVEAIAGLVQMEMLEAGYATNVEFHYLHHQPGGAPYANPAEMAGRIAAAAAETGIGLTLLPVHYQFGGCDRRPLGPGQDRFGTDPDVFARLHAASGDALKGLPADTRLGVAPHSLRAVAPEALPGLRTLGGPFHMHLAEQVAEVEEVRDARGLRPVEWVLEHMAPDAGCTFIHCTRMQPHETEGLARSGAVAGLCPITESSLGDGIFDGVRWMDNGGALAGGARSAGRDTGAIAPGLRADLLALDGRHVDMEGRRGDTLLDTWIFAGDDRMVREVWSAGRHVVTEGRHIRREGIAARYRAAMRELGETI
jgi:formimidoylglutamate deiminase